jgi:Ca2+-binding RTX toxin-like protein
MANIFGTFANETFVGTIGADLIHAGGGDDSVQGGAGDDTIYGDLPASGSTGGGGSGLELRINTTTIGSQVTPELVSLSNGTMMAFWSSAPTPDAAGLIMGQLLSATGQPIGGEFQVSSNVSSNLGLDLIYSNPPSGLQLSNGNVLVTWTDSSGASGNEYSVYGRLYDASGTPLPQGEFLLTDEANSAWQVNNGLAPDANGGFRLVYQPAISTGDPGYGVWMRSFDANGVALGSSQHVNTYTPRDQGSAEIAQLAGGGHVVVWISLRQGETSAGGGYIASNVYMQRYDASGAALGGETLVHPGFTSDEQLRPHITALQNGSYVVTWESWGADGSAYGIFARHFDAAGNGGAEFQVNTTSADNQRLPEITKLANGGYVITWQADNQDGNNTGVYYRVFDANDVGGPETLANITIADRQMTPTVAALSGGGFAIAWTSADGQDGDSAGIYAQYFDSTGAPASHPGDDILRGGAGADRIFGDWGNDLLFGDAGNDALFGGDGDDAVKGGGGADYLDGGKGDDVLTGNGADDLLYGRNGDDVLSGNGGVDLLEGNGGADFLKGGGGDDVLNGGSGKDRVLGGGGLDQILGQGGSDSLNGGAGLDLIYGQGGKDSVVGGGGNDDLFGGNGSDRMFGGGGSDHIFGDFGKDDLTGGGGADFFVFIAETDSLPGPTADRILDFVPGTDVIDLTAIDANTATTVNDAFQALFVTNFSGVAGELTYSGGVLAGDITGDGLADFEINLVGALLLQPSDILL